MKQKQRVPTVHDWGAINGGRATTCRAYFRGRFEHKWTWCTAEISLDAFRRVFPDFLFQLLLFYCFYFLVWILWNVFLFWIDGVVVMLFLIMMMMNFYYVEGYYGFVIFGDWVNVVGDVLLFNLVGDFEMARLVCEKWWCVWF